jgi:TPR repeat protein
MNFSVSGLDSFKDRMKHRGGDHFYEFGCLAFNGNRSFSPCYEQAFSCFKQSAIEFNNLVSQFNLGVMYRSGLGVSKDEEEAFYWFLRSAENGYEKAQTIVATYLLEGKHVERDYIMALHWLRLAMSEGNAESYYYTSIIYKDGLGVDANANTSLDYLKTSANLGYDQAQFEFGRYLYELGPSHPEYVGFLRYLKLSSAQGNQIAQNFLVKVHFTENNIAFCPKKGVDLLVDLAKKNNVEALIQLWTMFTKGIYVGKDHKKALIFLKKAKDLGSVRALNILNNSKVLG